MTIICFLESGDTSAILAVESVGRSSSEPVLVPPPVGQPVSEATAVSGQPSSLRVHALRLEPGMEIKSFLIRYGSLLTS